MNGASGTMNALEREKEEEDMYNTVETLLNHGAIWNDLNNANETPGCIALRLNLPKIYTAMVYAGVRAELLFSKLEEKGQSIEENTAVFPGPEDPQYDVSENNHTYLKSDLRFRPGILLDSSDNAVMMDWERNIMERHAELLLPTPGLRVLNVGHGMGIVDRAIQERKPAVHHIIEAHPQVLARMRKEGWYDMPGVKIHEGRWQDVMRHLSENMEIDAAYYDTFAEDYAALRDFCTEAIPPILEPNGKLSWYHGLGADRQICYDVYTQVAETDMVECGYKVAWEEIKVPEDLHGSKQWEGTRRPYWAIDIYRLPLITWSESI